MKTKSLRNFIKEHRQELDDWIKKQNPSGQKLNDKERAEWIMNDENLYQWARIEGVRV